MGPPCTGAPPCAIAVVFDRGAPVREVIGASIGGIVTCGDGAPRRLALNAVDDPVWRAPVREVIGASTGGIVTCGGGAPTRLALNAMDDPVWGARFVDGVDATWCDAAPV